MFQILNKISLTNAHKYVYKIYAKYYVYYNIND